MHAQLHYYRFVAKFVDSVALDALSRSFRNPTPRLPATVATPQAQPQRVPSLVAQPLPQAA